MCFSATASFIAGGTLLATSAVTISKAQKNDKKYLVLASMPLWFGMQQISEGIVWTGVTNNDPATVKTASYFFLFWAFMFWPMFVPTAILQIEKGKKLLNRLSYLTLFGTLIGSLVYLPIIFGSREFETAVLEHHISYTTTRTVPHKALLTLGYLLVTIAPFFITKIKKIRIFGVFFVISIASALAINAKTFYSVWCFFAAALSLGILFLIPKKSGK